MKNASYVCAIYTMSHAVNFIYISQIVFEEVKVGGGEMR